MIPSVALILILNYYTFQLVVNLTDSVLSVRHLGYSFLNLNDIIYDEQSIYNLADEISFPITLLATSYAGAISLIVTSMVWTSTRAHQKMIITNQVSNMISIFKPKFVLPFAGEHFLTFQVLFKSL